MVGRSSVPWDTWSKKANNGSPLESEVAEKGEVASLDPF